MFFHKTVLAIGICFLLVGCAVYSPLPLETKPHLAASLGELQQADCKDGIAYKHENSCIDPAKPLTAADVTLLAIQYNPDLRTARNDQAIARAQVLQASVLPNPVVNGSYSFLISGPGTADAFGLGLSEDIKALIVRGAQRKSAQYAAGKADADILWQEWQLIGKARLLYVDLVEMEKLRDITQQNHDLFAARYEHSHRALLQGNADLTTVAPDLSALSDSARQLGDLNRQLQIKWQELDALLGLMPDVRLVLDKNIVFAKIDPEKIVGILPDLPHIRPDLVALQLGYQSQEEKLRAAILGQFPALVFGGNYGSDTTSVASGGPVVTLDLPLFNRNQGNIAIERSTRQKLHDEYTARLDSATGEVKAMMSGQTLLQKHFDKMLQSYRQAQKIAQHADTAFKAGNIDERSYVDLKNTSFNLHQQTVTMEQALLEQQVALATLIGADMPAIALPAAQLKEKP